MVEEAVKTRVESEALKAAVYTPDSFSVDEIFPEGEKEVVETTKTTEKEDDVEVEVEVEGKPKIEDTELADLKRQLGEAKSEILQLSTTIHGLKKGTGEETKSDEKPKLSRHQIIGILKEHGQDPEVLLNVIDYLAEEKALSTRDEALKSVSQDQWSSNLRGVSNRILSEDKYLQTNVELKSNLSEMSKNLGFADHPAGLLATYAIYRLSEFNKESSDDVESKRVETAKRVRGMEKPRTPDAQTKQVGLSTEQLQVAKKLGVDPKLYAKFVRRS